MHKDVQPVCLAATEYICHSSIKLMQRIMGVIKTVTQAAFISESTEISGTNHKYKEKSQDKLILKLPQLKKNYIHFGRNELEKFTEYSLTRDIQHSETQTNESIRKFVPKPKCNCN